MEEELMRSRGVVVRFSDQKGYGFIKPDDGGEDLFVHHSAIRADGYRTLYEGQLVEYLFALENEKTKAVDVTGPNEGPIDKVKKYGGRRGGRGGGYGSGNDGTGGYGFSRGNGRNANGYRGGGECYNCGGYGHMARDCTAGRGGGGGECYNCGGYGHLARDCTAGYGGGRSGGESCFRCGELGHFARDCNNAAGGGGGRGERGIFSRFGGGRSAGGCFNCGREGHLARECPN